MNTEPRREHGWLDRMVGEWTYESECVMGPDRPTAKATGVEVVRSLGGFWVVAEGEGEMPGGGAMRTIMTLGYDPRAGRYVGTFVASMMAHLWAYVGALDAGETRLTLDTEGPAFAGEGLAKYRDRIEFLGDDHRVMTSQILGDDGTWTRFMTAHYRRKG